MRIKSAVSLLSHSILTYIQPLKNKIALIAGAARGAGRGISTELGAAGTTVSRMDAIGDDARSLQCNRVDVQEAGKRPMRRDIDEVY